MIVLDSIAELRKAISKKRTAGNEIALVPTMGSLHEGHLKLIQEASKVSDCIVCSIFVNPAQFNDQNDFDKYPRSFLNDKEHLERVHCDILFAPSTDEIFTGNQSIDIDMGKSSQILEGKFRPGHFNGVALIVSKLFNIVQPDKAFFGQKDLQQLFLIKQLVADLNFPIEIITVPTLRNQEGLALSSRNRRLSNEGLKHAEIINESLILAKDVYNETQDPVKSKEMALGLLNTKQTDVEYFECVKLDTFEILDDSGYKGEIAFCVAAFVEGIRLIDNIIVKG